MNTMLEQEREKAYEDFLQRHGFNQQPYGVRVKLAAAFLEGMTHMTDLQRRHDADKAAYGSGPLDCPACGGSGHRNDVCHPAKWMQPTASDPLAQMCTVENDAIADLGQTMMERMAQKRAEGFAGWMTCAPAVLVHRLLSALWQGKYVDAANFTMMLRARGVPSVDVQCAMVTAPQLEQAKRHE